MGSCLKKAFVSLLFLLPALFGSNAAGGADASGLAVEPGKYDFGFMGAGSTSTPVIFTITNMGAEKRAISKIAVTNKAAYSVDLEGGPTPCGTDLLSLAAGERCTVSVRFQPFATGVITGDLTISSDRPDASAVTVPLSGFGIACGC